MEKVCSVTTDPTQCAFSLKHLVKSLLFVIVIIKKASISTTTPNPTEQPIIKAKSESKLPSRFLKKKNLFYQFLNSKVMRNELYLYYKFQIHVIVLKSSFGGRIMDPCLSCSTEKRDQSHLFEAIPRRRFYLALIRTHHHHSQRG